MYLETVDSAIWKPSFSNSPWMRGAPHSGFSVLIRRMSSRTANRPDGIFGNDKHFGGPYIALLNHPELTQHVEELGFF
jgi:hypothetical protein